MDVYLNNIMVKSLLRKDHIRHLEEAFKVLQRYGVRLYLAKCIFGLLLENSWGCHHAEGNQSIPQSDLGNFERGFAMHYHENSEVQW